MKDFLRRSLAGAMKLLQEHAKAVDLNNTNESTFRSFAMAEMKRIDSHATFQTEWKHRTDLLVQLGRRNAVVEFKYYITRPMFSLDGERTGWKGGAGPKNEEEFRDCVKRLRKFPLPGIQHKFVVLAFEATSPSRSKNSFADSYRNLTQYGVDRSYTVRQSFGEMVCKWGMVL